MDRDPLHDSVLEEALSNLDTASTPPVPVRWDFWAERGVPSGPSGPPAPMPYSRTVAMQTDITMTTWPLQDAPGSDEENVVAPDLVWQRRLGAMILHQLSLSTIAYARCTLPGPAHHSHVEWHPDHNRAGGTT